MQSRLLGTLLTWDLSWNSQTDVICGKISAMLGALGRAISTSNANKWYIVTLMRLTIVIMLPAWRNSSEISQAKLKMLSSRSLKLTFNNYKSNTSAKSVYQSQMDCCRPITCNSIVSQSSCKCTFVC